MSAAAAACSFLIPSVPQAPMYTRNKKWDRQVFLIYKFVKWIYLRTCRSKYLNFQMISNLPESWEKAKDTLHSFFLFYMRISAAVKRDWAGQRQGKSAISVLNSDYNCVLWSNPTCRHNLDTPRPIPAVQYIVLATTCYSATGTGLLGDKEFRRKEES